MFVEEAKDGLGARPSPALRGAVHLDNKSYKRGRVFVGFRLPSRSDVAEREVQEFARRALVDRAAHCPIAVHRCNLRDFH